MLLNHIFYTLKPAIPRRLQIFLRRQIALYKRKKYAHIWPIDPSAGKPPEGWKGWPDGKKFALVLSHDVDTQKGHDNVIKLAELEERLGFRSSFNFVPDKYKNSNDLHDELRKRGFEIGVHGLKHDGKLFFSQRIFNERTVKINHYLEKWNAVGFTSPSMHHNLDWMHVLNIKYSISTFDTDPFEPQPDGVQKIFPFYIKNGLLGSGYVELPYSLPQDHLLFVILKEKNIEIWKRKLDWIAEKSGMALLNTHSDYMNFNSGDSGGLEYPVKHYADFLEYVRSRYEGRYYHAKPSEIADFYKQRYLISSALNSSIPQPNKPNQLNQPKYPINFKKSKTKRDHILFIVENNTVPRDIRVWREAKTAKQAGYTVSVIAPVNDKYLKRYEVLEGIEVYRHSNIEHNGDMRYQILEYINAFMWETYLSIKIFIRKPFQVIHAANPPDNLFLIGLIFKIFGVKFIFDHHDLSPELYLCKYQGRKNLVFRVLIRLERCSCRAADIIISTNNSFRRHVIEKHGIAPEKIFVLRNDPEINQQKFEAQVQKDNRDPIILIYVGTINVQDGVDLLVQIVNILVNEFNFKCIECKVVGDGDRLLAVKQLAKDLGLGNFFQFTGYIYDRQLVNRYIQEADICLETAPYNEANRSSTFIKIMEYMAAGKPVVAFDLDETRASVGDAAILIEPGNLHEFAHAINNLINDPPKRLFLGSLARNRIVKSLNWETASSNLKIVYDNLLSLN